MAEMDRIDPDWKDFSTLEGFISAQERMHPDSRGIFSNLLRRVGVASKVIAARVQKAGLLDVLGKVGSVNVQDEEQQKLDVIANSIMKATFRPMEAIVGMASEEEEEFLSVSGRRGDDDHYLVMFDPLDGSSNIDANVSVGTIFSIHRCQSNGGKVTLDDFLQRGARQEAAGYVIYGSSTMFVYTTGHGVHGFTLDPEVGEYILSHENIRIPDQCKCFSANDANYNRWDEPTRRFADHVRYSDDPRYAKTSSRYIGSLVADFHRNMLYGGVFMYPLNTDTAAGKLRLLYECAPMAMLAEQAGGLASTGRQRILDLDPTSLHQRVPFCVGNRQDILLYEQMCTEYDREHR